MYQFGKNCPTVRQKQFYLLSFYFTFSCSSFLLMANITLIQLLPYCLLMLWDNKFAHWRINSVLSLLFYAVWLTVLGHQNFSERFSPSCAAQTQSDSADWLSATMSHWWSKCLARVAGAGHIYLSFINLASCGKIINPSTVLLKRDKSPNTLLTLLKRTGADGVTQSASAASPLCSPSSRCPRQPQQHMFQTTAEVRAHWPRALHTPDTPLFERSLRFLAAAPGSPARADLEVWILIVCLQTRALARQIHKVLWRRAH